ncbi:hypothetical protein GUY61_23725, partial [Streptomyces sp. GC420]|nr:hypothetical protein [Streptomyces sp. GC420]
MRRWVAAVTGLALFAEAAGVVMINWILGRVVDRQSMSLDGLDPGVMATTTWVMGGVFGLYLVGCGAVLLTAAVRDRGPGRWARIVLITCAVVHGVLGALAVGLVGWNAFACLMVVLGLMVLSLLSYGERGPAQASPPPPG